MASVWPFIVKTTTMSIYVFFWGENIEGPSIFSSALAVIIYHNHHIMPPSSANISNMLWF